MRRPTVFAAATAALLCAVLAGCGPRHAKPLAAEPAPSSTPVDYLSPPELSVAARAADGTATLSGVARPGAVLRLAAPNGTAIGATAGASGAWTLVAPATAAPRLYSLSEIADGRMVRARGYIAILPAPGAVAVMLRPGGAAEPLSGGGRTSVATVDLDRSGAAVVGGQARPGEAVHLKLDGADAGEDQANARGVFAVSLSNNLGAGPHLLAASTPSGQASAAFNAAPADRIDHPPFDAARVGSAWRIDWMAPGGGVQTTIVFDPPGAAG